MAQTNFNISQVESPVYTASTTGTDTYTATLVPTPTSLVTGQKVRIKFTTANTGACSLNLNSLGAVNIKTQAGNDPADGDIAAASIRELTYDGTNFVLNVNRATTAEQGIVEMSTDAEVLDGTDQTRYVNPKQIMDNYVQIGYTSITTASNNLKISADTEQSLSSSTTWTKKKEIIAGYSGVIRVTFDLKLDFVPTAVNAQGQIYKNGSAFGTLRSMNSDVYQTFTEDLTFTAGDLIQLYIRGDATSRIVYCRNFRLYFDLSKTSIYIINLN